MKKTILITIGVLTLLIVLGVWMYLFMYGAPKSSDEVFARFGFSGTEVVPTTNPEDTFIDVEIESEEGVVQNLRQLTTRPVAGASFAEEGIRYVEQGTGHIYSINLTTGEEVLLSGTTIPSTEDAVFSTNGMYVAITSHDGATQTLVGSIETAEASGGSFEGSYLPLGATEIEFTNATGTLRYLLKGAGGSAGYSYNILKDTGTQLFSIPLRDIHVLWGTPTYVYTTPTSVQEGYLYRVDGNNLEFTIPSAFALMANAYSGGVLVTSVVSDRVSTQVYTGTSEVQSLPVPFITEKCIENPGMEDTLYCSSPYEFTTNDFPDAWYKGVISYSDILWRVDALSGESTVLSNFLEESGREIDVSKIGTNPTGAYIYFVNKNDNALWMFDTTI